MTAPTDNDFVLCIGKRSKFRFVVFTQRTERNGKTLRMGWGGFIQSTSQSIKPLFQNQRYGPCNDNMTTKDYIISQII